ncbi:hypothetical protein WA026_004423 [Henosepilachna vigintioctopunctata]|uniref:Uncharacterized protein n=1 Tax=Henosepilachna vigintioctopunctata TaxID=420089 RepID=A0AAW1V3B5_9CUCU
MVGEMHIMLKDANTKPRSDELPEKCETTEWKPEKNNLPEAGKNHLISLAMKSGFPQLDSNEITSGKRELFR